MTLESDTESPLSPSALGSGPVAKPWIEAIHAYVPGKSKAPDGRRLVKLSANENPLGPGPAARAALENPRDPVAYPDPDATALRKAIGAAHGIDPARIVCGTGSDELLNLAAQGYAGSGDEVLYVRHGFSVYEIAARRCGATPVVAPDRDYTADPGAILDALTTRTRVVFLANPNNPTGTAISAVEVNALHAALPDDALFVLDQAYGEYVDPAEARAGLDLAAAAENVLVTRTFSKIHGLAGERIGWATGAPGLIATLNRIRGPFNVTTTGQAAAAAAIGDAAFIARSAAHNREERARFVEAIAALGNHGLATVPSEANFVLVRFEGALTAEAALAGLAEAGYAVRHLPAQGLPDALRITIGTATQMDDVAATLKALAETASC